MSFRCHRLWVYAKFTWLPRIKSAIIIKQPSDRFGATATYWWRAGPTTKSDSRYRPVAVEASARSPFQCVSPTERRFFPPGMTPQERHRTEWPRFDDPGKGVQLRARRRPPPPIPPGHREHQHLGYRPRVNPKTSRRFPLAHTFNLNRKTNPSVQLRALHPPAPAAFRQRPSAAGFLFRRYRTARSLQ